jgi:hypothetical protein
MDEVEPLDQFLASRPFGLESWRLRDRLVWYSRRGKLAGRYRQTGLSARRLVGWTRRGLQVFEGRVDDRRMPYEHVLDSFA